MPRFKIVSLCFLVGMLAAMPDCEAQSKSGVSSSTFGLGNGHGQVNSEYGKLRVHNKDGSVKKVDDPDTYKVDKEKGEYKRPHYGIDIPSKDADGHVRKLPFKAGVYGVVVPTPNAKWGTISVKMPDGRVVQYLHASARTVPIGSFVTPETVLGITGNTAPKGTKLPIHLHVQVLNADWTTPKNLKDGDPNVIIPRNQKLPKKLPAWFQKLSDRKAKQYQAEWRKNGKWTAFEGVLPKGSVPPGGKAPIHQSITFDDSAAKVKPNTAASAKAKTADPKSTGSKQWAAEIVGIDSKITRIGVYNSYAEAQRASLAWSKANPKDLRLTREIELGTGKATGSARIGFDDNAKKVPASSLKGSKTAAKPAARAVPQQPRTRSKLTVKKAPRRRSPTTSKPRTGSRSKATVGSRRVPTSKPRSNSTATRRPSVRKPAAGNRSPVRRTNTGSGSRGVVRRNTANRSAGPTSSANRNRTAVRSSASSTVRRTTTTSRPTYRRPSTSSRSTDRRPAVRSNGYSRSSATTARRSTYRRPSTSSNRTPARTADYRRPVARTTYRSPVRTATYRRPTYRPPAYRPAVRRSSYTPRRSYAPRVYRRR